VQRLLRLLARRSLLLWQAEAVPSCSEDLRFRGLVYQVSDDGLFDLLDKGAMTCYAGFDPTSDSLHVGNLLPLCTLRRLQLAGHRPLVVAGGGTALIGDPGGKTEERALLSHDEVRANLERIRPQLERFLDFSPAAGAARASVLDNAEWLTKLRLLEFLRQVGKHVTVNQMAAKEAVRARLERPDRGISYAEFSYMLLQGYDFLHLYDTEGCTLQLGASDQWGSITTGIELIRKLRGQTAYAMTTPLVLKPDGTKYGKSESGAIYLDAAKTSPFELYQHFLRTDDSVVGAYLRFFTFLGHEEIAALDEATATRPSRREAQQALALEVCRLVHGDTEAHRAKAASAALYSEEISTLDEATLLAALGDAPHSKWPATLLEEGGGLDLVSVLVDSGLVASRRAARQAIDQGGIYLNNRRAVLPGDARLTRRHCIAGRYVLLRRGRHDVHLLAFV
jgi:tyrosyl-tRNA synthetase